MSFLAPGEAIMGAISEGGSALCSSLWDKISASNNLDTIYGALNETVKTLLAKRDDYQNRLQRHKSKKATNTYIDWVDRVTKIENDVKDLEIRFKKENKRWRILGAGFRSEFCQELKDKRDRVLLLTEEGNQLGEFIVDPPAKPVELKGGPNIQKFYSLQMHLDKILDLLRNDKVKGIRIHGMVGSGKTAIMQSLNNHEEVGKMFDIVVWVKVSTEGSKENFSTEQLQRTVVQRLKLDMESTDDAQEVAKRIREGLVGKRYLLLLDDVKQDLNLYHLGIHESKNNCKIVLTTRFGHVCSSIVNRVIKVNCLSQDEAWNMFHDVLERPDLKADRKFSHLAWKIVKRCGGLPLVIKLVASDFRMRNNEDQWDDGFNNFRYWPDIKHEGMEELYKLLNFCFNNLNNAQKNCFHYGALYSEDSDIPIECLLECWAAEHFLGSNDDADKQRIHGRSILQQLKNVSLFEEGANTKYVRMHKIIRQVALHDSAYKHLVKTNEAMRKSPDMIHWLEKNWISLMDNELQTLPDSPDCRMLSTLFLQKNLSLKAIPPSFFRQMVTLRVLDLYCTGIVSLPQSLSEVISLKVLYLKDCIYLTKLPYQLESLQHLEVLDLQGTGVQSIPSFLKNLIRLRRLLVSFPKNNSYKVSSNCKVISELSALRELVIDVEAPRKQWGDKMLSTTIEKIVTLKLTTLQFRFTDETVDVIKVETETTYICVPDAAILGFFIKRDDLCFASFQVRIGWHSTSPKIPMSYPYERYMKCESYNPTVSELLAKADLFELINHRDTENLMEFVKSMNQVRGFQIESCNEIGTIVDGNSMMNSPILPNLEQLYINNLSMLKSIWEGHVPCGSLCKLKTLVVSRCPMLLKIFSQGLFQQLSGIQLLEIEDCFGIEEIIMESEDIGLDTHVLPNLEKMKLYNMPNLRSICANESFKWKSLKELEIHGCPRLNTLSFTMNNASNLRSIKTEQDWWDALQWQHHEVKEHFQQYCTFSVMATTTNAVDPIEAVGGENSRDMSSEAPSTSAHKRVLSAAEKGKAIASSGKRVRVDQSSGGHRGISIREAGTNLN
ncbi:Disease resistance protein [Actinidia chinensis var. chinensis]|uniref:Disease resistance protein n=1 Tax=Actinidia chinensis var. chinensis TaxID=1590841 RepID=A0A2R6R2E6_ACTCC|nr:Disease resistance protein [Actinidia chinensis var. chinensis]